MTTVPTPEPAKKRPGPLTITLIVVGGVLLLTIVVLLALLLGRGLTAQPTADGTPTPTATSSTPTATPTEAAPPPPPAADTTPRFTRFDAVTEVRCPNSGDKPEIQFSWETANATEVWYTSGHEDAVDDNYMQVPLAGSQADLTDEHLFPCAHRQTSDYTLTLVGTDGSRVSQYWTVIDLNWGQSSDDEEDE